MKPFCYTPEHQRSDNTQKMAGFFKFRITVKKEVKFFKVPTFLCCGVGGSIYMFVGIFFQRVGSTPC